MNASILISHHNVAFFMDTMRQAGQAITSRQVSASSDENFSKSSVTRTGKQRLIKACLLVYYLLFVFRA